MRHIIESLTDPADHLALDEAVLLAADSGELSETIRVCHGGRLPNDRSAGLGRGLLLVHRGCGHRICDRVDLCRTAAAHVVLSSVSRVAWPTCCVAAID